jgi:HSP20 family protein
MSLVQWNPFREMDDLLTRFARGPGGFPVLSADARALANWAPAVDISENAKEYLVKAELPGVKKEDLKVTSLNGVLTISGERKLEKEDKDEKHHRVERSYGSFTRSFTIPDDVLEEQIAAECKEGVVTVRLPKTEQKKNQVKQITVQ